MHIYSDQVLSEHQHRFREGHSTHYKLKNKNKKGLDNPVVGRMLLTDLSKAFYCLRQD